MRYPYVPCRPFSLRNLLGGLLSTAAGSLALVIAAPLASANSSAVWDQVAMCESSGNWAIDTGNGFYGGLQFTADTWAGFGGLEYAANAHLATREQQIAIAEKVLASQGPGAWPTCSIKAGLSGTDPLVESATSAPDNSPASSTNTPTQTALAQVSAEATETSRGAAPVDGAVITTAYGQPGAWAAGFHTGVDFAVPTGTPVNSVASGTIVSAGWQGAYGNAVVVRHDDGMYTLYAHLSTATTAPGQQVTAGQQIGVSGSTGNSTGPHLHFEARTSNNYDAHMDPLAYLRTLGVNL
ncbi:peptidoglycan DD-metalloendopeptidase family protein [Streptomyces sp. NPDC058664]|uniref:peptidoglycan DD-metalloendopeptidase family protein n=1 Tax=unclassified Streptomyces TaxID=2593676 RepID=UPI00366A112C